MTAASDWAMRPEWELTDEEWAEQADAYNAAYRRRLVAFAACPGNEDHDFRADEPGRPGGNVTCTHCGLPAYREVHESRTAGGEVVVDGSMVMERPGYDYGTFFACRHPDPAAVPDRPKSES